jgi:hypothetical protein
VHWFLINKLNSPRAKLRQGEWSNPLMDHVKMNVDASFDVDDLAGTTELIFKRVKDIFLLLQKIPKFNMLKTHLHLKL